MKRLLPHCIWIVLLTLALIGWASPTGNQEGGFHISKLDEKWRPHVIRMAPIRIEGERFQAPEGIDAKAASGWQPTECAGPVECLARIYFHEHEGGNRADQQLIFHVLTRVGGRDRPTLRAMKAYSSRATGIAPPGGSRTRWIAQLRLDAARPPAYDRSEPWTVARGRWMAAVDAAQADLRSPPMNPCNGPVTHWGAPNLQSDFRYPCEQGWVQLDCQSLNIGWCTPATMECPSPPEEGICSSYLM